LSVERKTTASTQQITITLLDFANALRFKICPATNTEKKAEFLMKNTVGIIRQFTLSTVSWCAAFATVRGYFKRGKFERKFADCKNLHRYFGISA